MVEWAKGGGLERPGGLDAGPSHVTGPIKAPAWPLGTPGSPQLGRRRRKTSNERKREKVAGEIGRA